MALSSIAVAKMPRRWQNVMIVISVVICSSAIFYRYGMELSWEGGIDWKTFLLQMMQVCNFNFILLPLMLIPKFKLARQYSIYFSMFAASTTLFALNNNWGGANWYEPIVFNSWLYHSFAMICPLWMFASGRLRPERKYLIPVSASVFGYFGIVYAISEVLKGAGIMAENQSFSYIYNADGIPILSTFHKWLKVPFWHLLPAFGIIVVFFCLFSLLFTRSIQFDVNGGEGTVKKLLCTMDCEVKLPCYVIDKNGNHSIGWGTDPNGEVQYLPGETIIMSKKNMQLYAIWNKENSVG